MKRIAPAFCVALLLGLASLVHAGPPARIPRDLETGALDPATAALAWQQQGVSPQQALDELRSLQPLETSQGDQEVTLRDRYQRETPLYVRLPESPDANGRYRVVIALHGLGANARQPLHFAPDLLPPHTILAAPGAQRIPQGLAFEDLSRVNNLQISRRMQHWWSYREGSFPLLALDYLRSHYPIDGDRVALLGYSMGGFGTWNVGLRFHDRFSALVPISGGLSRLEYLPLRDKLSSSLLDNGAMQPIFLVHGTADPVVPTTFSRRALAGLEQRGCDVTSVFLPGVDHWPFTALAKDHPGQIRDWLAQQVRDPHPKQIVHRVLGTYQGGAYWIRVDGVRGEEALVHAKVVARDRIEVSTENVSRLTVFLDPALVDVDRPLTLVVDGRERVEQVQPSLAAVAGSYARTHDPELTYSRAISLDLAASEK